MSTPSILTIEALLGTLDQSTQYRVYVTCEPGSEPTEVATRNDFRMLPSQLKLISWFLVIRDPIEIVFESHTRVSFLLSRRPMNKHERLSRRRINNLMMKRTSKSRDSSISDRGEYSSTLCSDGARGSIQAPSTSFQYKHDW